MLSGMPVEARIDPRIKRTRGLIGQAFSEVMIKKGFQAVSVQDITEKAGINRSTFYLHFADKFALLDYSITHMFRTELEKRSLNLCHYSAENMLSLVVTLAEFIGFSNSHCTSTDPQFEALVELQVKKQVQELLQVWGEKANINKDPKWIAIAGSWALYGLALDWNHNKKRSPVEQFAKEIMPILDSIMGLEQPA